MWFKKKITVQQNQNDDEYLSSLPAKVDVLLSMIKDEDLEIQLKKIRFLVENLSVSPKEKVISIDKTISNELSDIRIDVAKEKGKEYLESKLKNVEILLQERKGVYYGK